MGACSSAPPPNTLDAPACANVMTPVAIAARQSLHVLKERNLYSTAPFAKEYKLLMGDEYELGSGAFSVVRVAVHRATGKHYAVKTLVKDWMKCMDRVALLKEVETLSNLNHENIVRLVDFREDEDFFFVVQELCTGGTLCDRLVKHKTSYTEDIPQGIVRTLAKALQYVHSQGVIHRDLKPDNILMSSPDLDATLKVADFGLAATFKPHGDESHSTPVGTPNFVAPEVIQGHTYGREVDVWALGAIMYSLIAGYPPFLAQSRRELFDKITAGRVVFHRKYWTGVSEEAKDLIRRILVTDPAQRLTLDQVLQHPWLSEDLTDRLRGTTLDTGRLALMSSMSSRSKGRMKPRRPAPAKLDSIMSPASSGGSNRRSGSNNHRSGVTALTGSSTTMSDGTPRRKVVASPGGKDSGVSRLPAYASSPHAGAGAPAASPRASQDSSPPSSAAAEGDVDADVVSEGDVVVSKTGGVGAATVVPTASPSIPIAAA